MPEQISKGNLLISEPFLNDPNFKRTLILLTEHNENGSIGFVLNKPTEYRLNDIIEDFPKFDSTIYYGGPVQLNTLHFLHKADVQIGGSIEVIDGLFWGGNYDQLKLLIEADAVKPEDFRFFVGYSGWMEDQLTDEMEINSWILHPATIENIFSDKPENLWREVLKSKGKKFAILSSFPENPSVN